MSCREDVPLATEEPSVTFSATTPPSVLHQWSQTHAVYIDHGARLVRWTPEPKPNED